eukprot:247593-Chlamydomonas_euryale.AAC.2
MHVNGSACKEGANISRGRPAWPHWDAWAPAWAPAALEERVQCFIWAIGGFRRRNITSQHLLHVFPAACAKACHTFSRDFTQVPRDERTLRRSSLVNRADWAFGCYLNSQWPHAHCVRAVAVEVAGVCGRSHTCCMCGSHMSTHGLEDPSCSGEDPPVP